MSDVEKIKILLKSGADSKETVYGATIWSFAFSRDIANGENNRYLPAMLPYIFNNFNIDFLNQATVYVNEAINEYKAITKRSKMVEQTLGCETSSFAEKLDNQYNSLLEAMCDNIESMHYQTIEKENINKNEQKQLKLKNEYELKRSKFKVIK